MNMGKCKYVVNNSIYFKQNLNLISMNEFYMKYVLVNIGIFMSWGKYYKY